MSESSVRFAEVSVEPGPASEDGLSLRFKIAGEERAAQRLRYEAEDGTDGIWRVFATDDPEGDATRAATRVLVEDSSAGTSCLIVGGAHGLVLVHEATGARVREPYLLLSAESFDAME